MPSAGLLMGLTVVEGCTGRVVWRSYSRWGKAQEGIGRNTQGLLLCGPEQSGGWAGQCRYRGTLAASKPANGIAADRPTESRVAAINKG